MFTSWQFSLLCKPKGFNMADFIMGDFLLCARPVTEGLCVGLELGMGCPSCRNQLVGGRTSSAEGGRFIHKEQSRLCASQRSEG